MADWAAEISRVTDAKLDAFTANLQEQLAAMQGSVEAARPEAFKVSCKLSSIQKPAKPLLPDSLAPPAPVQQLGVGDMFRHILEI